MKKSKVLNKVYKNKMSAQQAYQVLYQPHIKQTHFVLVRMFLKGKWVINLFLFLLFLLPIPVGLFKNVISGKHFQKNLDAETLDELKAMLEHKGLALEVDVENTYMRMKTI